MTLGSISGTHSAALQRGAVKCADAQLLEQEMLSFKNTENTMGNLRADTFLDQDVLTERYASQYPGCETTSPPPSLARSLEDSVSLSTCMDDDELCCDNSTALVAEELSLLEDLTTHGGMSFDDASAFSDVRSEMGEDLFFSDKYDNLNLKHSHSLPNLMLLLEDNDNSKPAPPVRPFHRKTNSWHPSHHESLNHFFMGKKPNVNVVFGLEHDDDVSNSGEFTPTILSPPKPFFGLFSKREPCPNLLSCLFPWKNHAHNKSLQ